MKYLAAAIAFGVIAFGYMFRFEYGAQGMRTNRWTSQNEFWCHAQGNMEWMTKAECKAARGE